MKKFKTFTRDEVNAFVRLHCDDYGIDPDPCENSHFDDVKMELLGWTDVFTFTNDNVKIEVYLIEYIQRYHNAMMLIGNICMDLSDAPLFLTMFREQLLFKDGPHPHYMSDSTYDEYSNGDLYIRMFQHMIDGRARD